MALVDTGFQISALTEVFNTEMGWKILPLRNLMGACCVLIGWGHFNTIQRIHRGTQVIDHLVGTMTRKELQQAGETWIQVHLSTIVSKRNTVKGLDVPQYDLEGVKGKIFTIREVVTSLLGTTVVKGIANFTTHSKFLNAVVEQVMGYLEHIAMAKSYGVLNQGETKLMSAPGIIVQSR